MNQRNEVLAANIQRVRGRIAAAAERSGRRAGDVLLVAVSKYVAADLSRLLVKHGCAALGENRPQQLWDKAAAMQDVPVQWHFIGNLQRNKVRRTLPLVSWLHALDSVRLIETVESEAARISCQVSALLEVNTSGDATKHGFTATEAVRLAPRLGSWPHVRIAGLMTMAAMASDAQSAREDFSRLRTLRDVMQQQCPREVQLQHLSMGMSRDFEAAIAEGATMVRVGSILFEGLL